MQIACMTWAVLLGRRSADARTCRLLLAVTFVALTAALFLTETRAALGGAGGWRLPLRPAARRKTSANLGGSGAGCCLWPRQPCGSITPADRRPSADAIPARNSAP